MANDVNVQIKTTADTAGVKKAEGSLKTLNEAGEKTASGFSALGSAIGIVDPQLGNMVSTAGLLTNGIKGVVVAIKGFLTTPIGLLLAAITAAFAGFRYMVNKTREDYKKLVEITQKRIDTAIVNANTKITNSFKAMARAIEDATDRYEHFNEIDDAKSENRRRKEDAYREQERQLLRRGKTPEQLAELEAQWANEDIARDLARNNTDVVKAADREYSQEIAERYRRQRNSSEYGIKGQKNIIHNLKQEESLYRQSANNTTLKDEDRKLYQDKLNAATVKRIAAEEKLSDMENELANLNREEAQAKERRAAKLEELDVNAVEAVVARGEVAAKLEEQQAQFKKEAEEKAKQDAENRLVYVKETHATAPIQLNDRISQLGGYASAGAQAVAGYTAMTETQRTLKAAEKTAEEAEKQTAILEDIKDNTKEGGAEWV